jgi:suppressor for copper-sensitivity B
MMTVSLRDLCLAGLMLLATSARADEASFIPTDLPSRVSLWDSDSQADTRLVAAETAVGPDARSLSIGWQASLKGRWKTYWRAPGDAGLAPVWDWSSSSNVKSVEVAWPTPERITVFGLESYVYSREVMLPLTVHLKEPGKAADLRLKLDYMVCEEICVPLEAAYRLYIPAGNPMPTAEAGLIRHYETLVPTPKGDVAIESASYDLNCGDIWMHVKLGTALPKNHTVDAFVAGPEGVSYGRPVLSDDRRLVRLPVRGLEPGDRRLSEALHLVVRPSVGKAVAWDGIPVPASSQKTCVRAGT